MAMKKLPAARLLPLTITAESVNMYSPALGPNANQLVSPRSLRSLQFSVVVEKEDPRPPKKL